MILRLAPPSFDGKEAGEDMWKAFVSTQQPSNRFSACITQPAHAKVAGQIAELLLDDAFGPLSAEILRCIGAHDSGWAQEDLAGLESTRGNLPESFLDVPAARAVQAWRQSIRIARQHSRLSGIVTSRHFCLLAPRDGDPAHESFVQEETQRRVREEEASGFAEQDLRRLTAALGFCDLLSLYLCSGRNGTVHMPIWHAADPLAKDAPQVTVTTADGEISMDADLFRRGSTVSVIAWTQADPVAVSAQQVGWRFC